jgi:hypothetical protein
MKKAIVSAAILNLALGSFGDEYLRFRELDKILKKYGPLFEKLYNDSQAPIEAEKKIDNSDDIIETNPKTLISDATKVLELNSLLSDSDSDETLFLDEGFEFSDNELFNPKKIEDIGKKIGHFVNQHQHTIRDAIKTIQDVTSDKVDLGEILNDGVNIIGDVNNNQLFNFKKIEKKVEKYVKENPKVIRDGVKTVIDVSIGNIPGAISEGIKVAHDVQDNQLLHLGKTIKKAKDFVNKNHRLIEDGVKTITDIADGNLADALKDGVKIVEDASNHQFNADSSFLGF